MPRRRTIPALGERLDTQIDDTQDTLGDLWPWWDPTREQTIRLALGVGLDELGRRMQAEHVESADPFALLLQPVRLDQEESEHQGPEGEE